MKKRICITPVDKTMEGWAQAVYLLNEFKRLNCTKREVFVDAVAQIDQSYKENFSKVNDLHRFWAMRERNPKLLDELNDILETLKNQQPL